MEVGELLYDKLSDICFFAETKLDDTFNQRSFNVVDYKAFRNDRNASGGGLMAYVRSNLPARRRPDLELQRPIETIVLDVIISDRKWAVIGVYRPPSVDNKLFADIFTKGIDKISTQYDNIMVAGDLNYDCLDSSKSKILTDICDIFDFTNLVKATTCFMKHCTPSLVDVFLTNKPNFCFNVLNFGCGISDLHNLIGVVVKGATARVEKKRVLPIISKAYERVMHNQLSEYFNDIFNPFLAAFRKGFGCQSTLLRLLEDWRKALDNHQSAAAVLMELSKAFDCLPHGLLIEKLRAYGLASDAIDLLSSYLSDRVQQVRLGSHTSTWEKIIKGVPQGSILGPLLFNVFLNDIFFFVNQAVIYNYADDNTLSFIHANIEVLKKVLEDESCILIDCFFKNFMKANPSKFQAICIGKNAHDGITSLNIDSVEIKCDDNVTLLGINIDFMLRFDDHVSEICKKASKQLAVLKRLGRFLTKQGKMTIYNSFIVSNFNWRGIFAVLPALIR